MTEGILEQPTFREWMKAEDQSIYDTPQETLTRALFRCGRVHTSSYIELYKYERDYINRQVNHSYGF